MQTRKLGLRALTLAMAGVLTLGLAACEETKTVVQPDPTVLTISPTGNVDLFVGDRIQVVANLQNPGSNATVTWASSNPAVATVDQSGNVTAVSRGISTITASATGNNNETLRAAMTVRVTARPDTTNPGGGNQGNASVFITGITRANGDPIATDNVSGTIVVRLEVTPGPADSLQVMIGNRRACMISFASASALITADGQAVDGAQVPLTCTVNTATLGVQNGATTVTARLFDNNAVIASNQQSLTLNNVSTVSTNISAARQATNPNTGLVWQDGAVTVRVTPAIFGGASVQRVTVSLNTAGGAAADTAITDTTATDGVYEVTFPETSTALAGVTTPNLRATITAIAGGEQFRFPVVVDGTATTATSITTSAIRYDNRAPEIRTGRSLATRAFFGNIAATTGFFAASGAQDTVEIAGEEVEGVNAVRIEFFALQTTNTTLPADSVFARGTAITSGSNLTQGQQYRIAARACDALGNCRTLTTAAGATAVTTTVDINAPEIIDIAPEDTAIFNAGDATTGTIVVELSDDVSGFGTTPFLVTATRTYLQQNGTTFSTVTECVIGDEATATTTGNAFTGITVGDFDGDGPSGDDDNLCEAVAVGSIPVPDAAGYYNYSIRGRDVAGNVSASTEQLVLLVDGSVPTITEIDFSASLDGGDQETVSGRLTDNLDLYQYQVVADFGGGFGLLPLTTMTSLDNSFGTPLTRRQDVTPSVFFISSLTEDSNAGDAFAGNATFSATRLGFQAWDQARNMNTVTAGIAQTFAVATPAVTGYNVDVVGNDDEICISGDCEDADDSKTVRAVVTENLSSDNASPVERVNFYFSVGATRVLFAVDTTASVSVTTANRSFTYTAQLTTEALQRVLIDMVEQGLVDEDDLDGSVLPIFAVAIDEDGNAIYEITSELTLEED